MNKKKILEGPRCPTVTMVQMDSLSSFSTASHVRPFSNEVHSHTSTPAFAGHLSLFGWCPSAIHFDKCTRTGHSALAEKVRISTELITKRCCSADGWLLESELWRLINELLGGVSGTQRAPCVKQAGKDNLGKLNRLKGMREYRTKECERMLMHGRALWLHNAAIKRFSVTSLNEKCGFIIGRVSVAMMSEKKHRNERSGSHLLT